MQRPNGKTTCTVENIPMDSNLAYGEIKQQGGISLAQNMAYVTTSSKKPTAASESLYDCPVEGQNRYTPCAGRMPPFSASTQQEKTAIDFTQNVAYGAKVSGETSDAFYEDPDYAIP